MLLFICALLPMVLGGALPFLRIRSRRLRMAYVLTTTLLTSLLALYLVFFGGEERLELFRLTDELVCALRLDGAGRIYLAVAALLWPFAVLYAVEYMRHEKREGNFFAWYTATYGVAVLLAGAENLFTLYIFYEFMTLCTLPLVWHEKDKASIRAVRRYMISLMGGAALGFVALIGLTDMGAGSFIPGGAALTEATPWLLGLCLMGFVGFGAKAAVFPLCRWLPSASVAPTPVTALLHAVAVVNAGVFAVMRLFYYVVPPALVRGTWAQETMLALSALTVLLGSVMAVREQHMKRRLAWSTVSNLSYMLFGLSLLSGEGMAAGLAHMAFHGVMKIILFFCAGAVLVQTGRTQVRQTHGLGRLMPLTFSAFTLAGTSLMGVPPLPGFVSKYALVTAAFHQGGGWQITGAVVLLISAVLTAIYIFTVAFPALFMKPVVGADEIRPRDPGPCMRLSLLALCALLVAAGVWAGPVMTYINGVAGGIGL